MSCLDQLAETCNHFPLITALGNNRNHSWTVVDAENSILRVHHHTLSETVRMQCKRSQDSCWAAEILILVLGGILKIRRDNDRESSIQKHKKREILVSIILNQTKRDCYLDGELVCSHKRLTSFFLLYDGV